VGAEVVDDDDVAFFQGWDENLLDIGGETLAVDGPSITRGASIRSQRKAAIKVIVFQWPCGA
jgi:hypothetical protein